MRGTISAFARSSILLVLWMTVAAAPACTPPEGTSISAGQMVELLRSGNPPLILDVRSREEFSRGHLPGAVNVPHSELASRLSELNAPRSEPVVVYCESGGRAETAESMLRAAGFSRILDLSGHMRAWRSAGLPLEK